MLFRGHLQIFSYVNGLMDPKVDFFLVRKGLMYCAGSARPQKKSRSRILPRPNLSSALLSAIPTIFLLPNRWYYLSSSWNILFTFTFQKILIQSKYLRKSVGVNLPSSQDESLQLHPSRRLALASPGWTLNFPSPLFTCPIIAIQVRLNICILFLLLQQELYFSWEFINFF